MSEELKRIGASMANVMFNLSQQAHERLPARTCEIMGKLRREWDDAVRATPSTIPASEAGEREAIEEAAKAIYRLFDLSDRYPWVEGGNSHMQTDARRFARAALASTRNASDTRKGWENKTYFFSADECRTASTDAASRGAAQGRIPCKESPDFARTQADAGKDSSTTKPENT